MVEVLFSDSIIHHSFKILPPPLEQCSGAANDSARCELRAYEDYVHELCEGDVIDYDGLMDPISMPIFCHPSPWFYP